MGVESSHKLKVQKKKFIVFLTCFVFLLSFSHKVRAAEADRTGSRQETEETAEKQQEDGSIRRLYEEYRRNFESVEYKADIAACGFRVIEEHIFPVEMRLFGEVNVIPAFDGKYHRLALFLALPDGTVVYKTDQLETNNCSRGELIQPTKEISAISLQDVDGDGRMDIVLITVCDKGSGSFKVGDVLFQNGQGKGFYRDYRISDKLNRFGMNKSIELITAFVRDGDSTEFLYTAATLEELLENGFRIIDEQYYPRNFEKLGRLRVVPGTYRIADYDVFMIYLVNGDGYIVSSLQPMGDYDNLYALRGISCRDIDGDGLKDIVVLARYSYEGEGHQLIVQSDYAIYYQRTGGFSADMKIKEWYPCSD